MTPPIPQPSQPAQRRPLDTLIPRATYRLQMHRGFRFGQAAALAPYLASLGISHVYTSPFFKARPGSTHGYDITDHNAFNPEIGSMEEFEAMSLAFNRHGLKLMLDIVPNHMGVMGADNHWWLDVLEHGRASAHADYFDIDWDPPSEDLRGKLLLPVLGDQYGQVLEQGELQLRFDAEAGGFFLAYHQHRFPLDPREYAPILVLSPEDSATTASPPDTVDVVDVVDAVGAVDAMDAMDAVDDRLAAMAEAFRALPGRDEDEAARITLRRRQAAALKQLLGTLCRDHPSMQAQIDERLLGLNGRPGDAGSYDRLHALIKAQAWRLAYWRVAAHDINYRRFFDINDLAALRMEKPEVFADTHRLALQLVGSGRAHALRIDHPDGLYDPAAYFARLQDAVPAHDEPAGGRPIYLVLEKILGEGEHLPAEWRVHGTTGYRYANVLNGLFVDSASEKRMTRVYDTFIDQAMDYEAVLHQSKMLIMNNSLASELNVLANMLSRIARSDRRTCDFTMEGLRRALREVVACFPVYRTYVGPQGLSAEDARHIGRAVTDARRRTLASEHSVFDFVHAALTLSLPAMRATDRTRVERFVGRFQQYTAPVMAKSMEDTAFYRYNRLVSLNEVGGDPRQFGLTLEAFHQAGRQRAAHWPHTMLATSTHDSKRSEDVRARINVLSEMPGAWRLALRRWRRLNRINRRSRRSPRDAGGLAPSRNDEYLLYQLLLGSWPLEAMDEASLADYRERIQACMLKAVREAKAHTSWISPDARYEQALADFIDRLLGRLAPNTFLEDFHASQAPIAFYGMLNSLSQTLLKLSSPGVPDIYQGNELWDFSLVDPDNRRPVDHALRKNLLEKLQRDFPAGQACLSEVQALLATLPDGRAKLLVTWRLLSWRAQHPALFRQGDYQPLMATGAAARHVCAYARSHGDERLVAIAPRLIYQLTGGNSTMPMGETVWGDARLGLPDGVPAWQDLITGAVFEPEAGTPMPVGGLLAHFPVALLVPASRNDQYGLRGETST